MPRNSWQFDKWHLDRWEIIDSLKNDVSTCREILDSLINDIWTVEKFSTVKKWRLNMPRNSGQFEKQHLNHQEIIDS
jgi:hypothetical protein